MPIAPVTIKGHMSTEPGPPARAILESRKHTSHTAPRIILIWEVYSATWDHGDNQTQAVADDHVWVHGPDGTRVYVNVHCLVTTGAHANHALHHMLGYRGYVELTSTPWHHLS